MMFRDVQGQVEMAWKVCACLFLKERCWDCRQAGPERRWGAGGQGEV